jgi:glycosyltransferase involved in cell wall biosynthesis
MVVVGAGWWADRLVAEADRLGVTDGVDFLGFVDEDRKHAVLDASWVLAVPSLKEGWGLGVMEAASHGVPAVAFGSAGGVAESIAPDETGILAADEEEFQAALRLLVTDPDLRARYGAAARERAKHYSWERTGAAFDAVVRRALEGGPPTAGVDPVPSLDVASAAPRPPDRLLA